jgi:HD-GYP domain-containing protein (c-di-GMP phosphodiesterase class II)/CHASE1-domain containing sensor protein
MGYFHSKANRAATRDPDALKRTSRILPSLQILTAGVVVSMAVFLVIRHWEHSGNQIEFTHAASYPIEAVRRAIERIELVHKALREYCYGSKEITRQEFAASAANFLPHVPSLKFWQWVPRVSRADRARWEEAAQHNGMAGFQITELDAQGQLYRADERDEYHPVWYTVSQCNDSPRLGWDLTSVADLRAALAQCRDNDKIVVTRQLTATEQVGEGPVFLTLLPVYRHPQRIFTVEDRRRELAGFLVGTCLVSQLVEDALRYDLSPHGVEIQLLDQSTPTETPLYLYTSHPRQGSGSGPRLPREIQPDSISYIEPITFGGRRWSLVCTPAPSFFAASIAWRSWCALAVCLSLTIFAAACAWAAATQRERVERLVDARTVQLREKDRQLREAQEVRVRSIRLAHEETIHRLVTASLCRDEETGQHIKRTGLLSEMLARAAGWSEADAEIIRLAAPMHDVGKIGIPDAILQKPGKLTSGEFETMKTHTQIGARMLEGSQSAILAMARDIAMCHHEHWDGTGYPRGLAGLAIPEPARILSIVDVYDAMTHSRVYRSALPEDEILNLMTRGAGTRFDPALLALFLANYEQMRRIALENPDEATIESDKTSLYSLLPVTTLVRPTDSDANWTPVTNDLA